MADGLRWFLVAGRLGFFKTAARLRTRRRLLREADELVSAAAKWVERLGTEVTRARRREVAARSVGDFAAWAGHRQKLIGEQLLANRELAAARRRRLEAERDVDEMSCELGRAAARLDAARKLDEGRQRSLRRSVETRSENEAADDRLISKGVRNPDTVSGYFGHPPFSSSTRGFIKKQ